MTRILFVGNWNVDWTTETHLARTLESLGHQVYRLQESTTPPDRILELARVYDVGIVWYQRTWGYSAFPPGAPKDEQRDLSHHLFDVWAALADDGRITVAYHLDLYVGLERESLIVDGDGRVTDPFWATSFVFTADGDSRTQAWMDAHGIRHYWMPPAVVHDETYQGDQARHRFPDDVAFVGSESYHAEHPERQELLAWARATYGPRFGRYGGGQDPARVIRGADLNSLYQTVPAIIGDSLAYVHPDGTRHRNYVSDRVFETLGRGGVLCHPNVPGLAEWSGLTHGEHLLYYEYGDYDTLAEHVDWCLTNRADARAMAERGREYVKAHHTYRDRLTAALAIIEQDRA